MIDRDETAPEPTSKMRTIIRQNSERIGHIAEVAVLPRYRRSTSRTVHRMNSVQSTTTQVGEVMPLSNAESDAMDAKVNTTVIPMPYEGATHEIQPKNFPVFMISLTAVQIVFMYFLNAYGNPSMLFLGYDPYRRYQIWRFFSIMLVHTRLCHLITNILLQLILGVLLEIVYNWPPIAAIYFTSVIGGSLFITLFSPNNYAVGASGGVYGLLASHLATIIVEWNDWNKKVLRLSMVLIYIFLDFYINWEFAPDDFDTNYASYVGGGITGFLISIVVLKDAKERQWKEMLKDFKQQQWKIFLQQQWKNILRIVCVIILACLAVIALLVNIFEWRSYLPTEWNKDYQQTYVEFAFQRAITKPEQFAAREYCKHITKCKILLNKFDVGSSNFTMAMD